MDFGTVFTAVSSNLTSNWTAIAAIIGTIAGIPLVWKIYKTLTR